MSKGLDKILDKTHSRKDTRAQLLEVLEQAIAKTYKQFNIFDKKTSNTRIRFIEKTLETGVNSENDFDSILKYAFGDNWNFEIKQYLLQEFFKILSLPQYQQAYNFCMICYMNKCNNTTQNNQITLERLSRQVDSIAGQRLLEENKSNNAIALLQGDSNPYDLISQVCILPDIMINRNKEREKLRTLLESNPYVFVGGMHGIGKTALISGFVNQVKSNFDCIVYAKHCKSLFKTVIDDTAITVRGMSKNDYVETDDEYYHRKMAILKKIVNQKTLIIFDDVQLEDECLSDIRELNAKVIFITTDNVSEMPDSHIEIDVFQDNEDVFDLFMAYYKRSDISKSNPDLLRMFELCKMHTYTVKLLALQMRTNKKSPSQMRSLLEEKGLHNAMTDKIYVYINGYRVYKPAFDFIVPLFQIDKLSDNQKFLLSFLSFFTEQELYVDDIENWLQLEDLREIVTELANNGWVNYIQEEDTVSLHPIISSVIWNELNPSVDLFVEVINRIMSDYTDFELNIVEINKRTYFGKIAAILIKKIDSFDLFYPFLTKAERALSCSHNVTEALNLTDKIEKWLRSFEEQNYFALGRIVYCRGWTYASQLRDRKTGLAYMEEGLSIICSVQQDMTKDYIRLMSDIYGDISLNRARLVDGNKDTALKEIQTAIQYYTQLNDGSSKYYSRLSWLEAFAVECYIQVKDYDSAEQCLQKSLSDVMSGPGKNSFYYFNVLYREAMLYNAQGKYKDALRIMIDVQSAYLKYYPSYTIANLEHLVFIANLFYKDNNVGEARKYMNAVLQTCETVYGIESKEYSKYYSLMEAMK